MEVRSIWLRLGVCMTGSEKEISSLLNGDCETLIKMIEDKKFTVEGDTYIPAVCVAEYNEKYGTEFAEEDIVV